MMNMFDNQSAKPMLIGMESKPFDSDDWIFELKLDGERCLAYLDKNETRLVNKQSVQRLSQFPELRTLNQAVYTRCILDGELIILDENGHPDGEEVKRRILMTQKRAIDRDAEQRPAVFVVFDILYETDWDVTSFPLMERKAILNGLVNDNAQLSVSRYVESRGITFYELAKERHMEEIVARKKNSLYVSGKRTQDWIRIKNLLDDDYIICGYVDSAEYVASLVLGQFNSRNRIIYKGRVTLAKSSYDFDLISKQRSLNHYPFSEVPPSYLNETVWIPPILVCRVSFMARNASGFMRQPVYRGVRLDKTVDQAREPAEMI